TGARTGLKMRSGNVRPKCLKPKGEAQMFKKVLAAAGLVATIAIILAASSAFTLHRGIPLNAADSGALEVAAQRVTNDLGFTVEVLIGATPAEEYGARGRTYIEALENAEYQIRIHNPTGARVA